MAIGSNSLLTKFPGKTKEPLRLGARRQNINAFDVSLKKIDANTGAVNVKVSKYSGVFIDFNLLNALPLIGIDVYFPLILDEMVYLEVFYDRFGNPLAPRIKYGQKWDIKTINPGNATELLDVYPKQIELITYLDLDSKVRELAAARQAADEQKTALFAQLDEDTEAGLTTAEETTDYKAALTLVYQSNIDDLLSLENSLNEFFNGSTSLRRKQFRSFTPICYTTDDFSPLLGGETVSPKLVVDPRQTQNVVLEALNGKFKIVPALNNDLMIQDIFYQDNYPCKIPMPFQRGQY